MEEKISIIVPVYNKAAYLPKCLESLQVQTYQNIEVVLVDDGSMDSSAEVCQSFCARDARFHYLHQENGGQTAARKSGVEAASGAWVKFVDADDFVVPEMCEWLMKRQCETNADLVISTLQMWTEGKLGTAKPIPTGTCSGVDAVRHLIEPRFFRFRVPNSVVSLFCRKQSAQKALDSIDPRITFNEDFGCGIAMMIDATTIAFLPKVVYYYRQVPESYTHTHDKSNVLMHKWLLEFLQPLLKKHGIGCEDAWVLDWTILRAFLLGGYEYFNDFDGCYPFFSGKRGGRIAVYGAGVIGEEIVTKLTGFDIVGWYDRNWKHYRAFGRSVDAPEKLSNRDCEDIIIAIQDPDVSEAVRQELLASLPTRIRVHTMSEDIINSAYSVRKLAELRNLDETYHYEPRKNSGGGYKVL